MPRAAAFKLETDWSADKQTDLVIEELMKVARDLGKAHKKEREKTIATWQGERPAWLAGAQRVENDVVLLAVIRRGDQFGKKKWGWLDEGTRIRYMHVSEDWESKTRPNFIGSGPGAGETIGLGPPLPGIEARNWNILINAKLNNRLERRSETAVRRGLKRRRKGKLGGIGRILLP